MSKTKSNSNNSNKNQDDQDLARKDLYNWKKTNVVSLLQSPSHSSLSSTRSPLPTNRSNKSILLKPISAISKLPNTLRRDKFDEKLRKKVNDLSELDNGNVDELLHHYEHDFHDSTRDKNKPDLVSLKCSGGQIS
jgi:hypothetical protein